MAFCLQTVVNQEQIYIRPEQGGRTFPRIVFIDPHNLMRFSPDDQRLSPVFTDEQRIKPEIMAIFNAIKEIIGLLQNSAAVQEILGKDQVVGLPELEELMVKFPNKPIEIDALGAVPREKEVALPPVLSFSLYRPSEVIPFPSMSLDFYPSPVFISHPDLPNPEPYILLRDMLIGERKKPTFHPISKLPFGLGLIDTHSAELPFTALMKYGFSNEWRISQNGVGLIDAYCAFTKKFPHVIK